MIYTDTQTLHGRSVWTCNALCESNALFFFFGVFFFSFCAVKRIESRDSGLRLACFVGRMT